MKINQILESISKKLNQKQLSFLRRDLSLDSDFWEVDEETGLIEVWDNIELDNYKERELPVQFGKHDHTFEMISCPNITTLKGIPEGSIEFIIDKCPNIIIDTVPEEVRDHFSVTHCNLETYKVPKMVPNVTLSNNKIKAFIKDEGNSYDAFDITNNLIESFDNCPKDISGLHLRNNKIKSLKGVHAHFNSLLYLDLFGNPINEGYLDLLKIPNLETVVLTNEKIEKIIMDNIGKGRKGQLAAQAAMIEAGFEDIL